MAKKERKRENEKSHRGRAVIITLVVIIVLIFATIYGAGVYFYSGHFYPGTIVGNIDASGLTADYVEKRISSAFNTYSLQIDGQNTSETISGEKISLQYKTENDEGENIIAEAMNAQNKFVWPVKLIANNSEEKVMVELDIKYDEEQLRTVLSNLQCINPDEKAEKADAYYAYEDGYYVVYPASASNYVSLDDVYPTIEKAIEELSSEVSIADFYDKLEESEEDGKIEETVEAANKILSSDITITTAYNTVPVDNDVINGFISIDDDGNVELDQSLIYEWVNTNISGPNYTIGTERTISTPSSGTITVSGGTYGNWVNVPETTQMIYDDLMAGSTITREPVYRVSEQSSENAGVGNTYIDVDISKQTVYVVKGGEIDYTAPCVTGLASSEERKTPTGVYYVSWKTTDWHMEEYDCDVKYWMPIDDSVGIGLHDATWRSSFGGSIYKSNGSHGCINLSLKDAEYIYNNTDVGIPVIVHE